MAWKLTRCAWTDKVQLNALLSDGWEPFAVTADHDRDAVWLRQHVPSKDAAAVETPLRPRHEPVVTR
jgi:hypothetical protein